MSILQVEPEVRATVPAQVLFVATGPRDRDAVPDRLGRMGLSVSRARDVSDALQMLGAHMVSVCVIDLSEERAAIASIRALRARHVRLAIVGIVDPTRPLAAAEAIHAGLTDLLPWPFESRDIAAVLSNARDGFAGTTLDGVFDSGSDRLVAHSPAMREIVDAMTVAAASRGGVLICGESSTGREAVARSIHARSGRDASTFVSLECRSMTPEELEMQLFGLPADRLPPAGQRRTAERIAKTSAIHQARGGTLFLMDLTEAPARTQAKLARLLRDGEAVLPDRRTVVDLDVRLMVALDPDPEASLADGRFRRDLFERLSVMRIDMPPLRRRREDIPLLASGFLRELAGDGTKSPRMTRSALALLAALPWPGNGRELRGVLETLVRVAGKPIIELDDVLGHVRLSGSAAPLDPQGSLRDARMRFEREWISATLVKHKGRVGDAARALGIQRTNLYRKVRQLNVARALLVRKG
jgi:DNA-binding NtrC family response regulator